MIEGTGVGFLHRNLGRGHVFTSWFLEFLPIPNRGLGWLNFQLSGQLEHISKLHLLGTGFEENKDLPIVLNSVIGSRYAVAEYLGSAAFSKVVQAHDLHTGVDVYFYFHISG